MSADDFLSIRAKMAQAFSNRPLSEEELAERLAIEEEKKKEAKAQAQYRMGRIMDRMQEKREDRLFNTLEEAGKHIIPRTPEEMAALQQKLNAKWTSFYGLDKAGASQP